LIDNPNEGVNQSTRYVQLNGATGVINVTPNPTNSALPHQAAVGRTPVVLAKVMNNGKVYAVGYIKIVITDNFDLDAISDIPTIVLDPFTLNCDAEYVFTDGNKLRADMDQVFNHERVKLGKDLFFDEYTGTITHSISSFVPAIPGNFANVTDFEFSYETYQDTQSGQLENYIEGTVKNTAPAGKYTIKTTLSSQGYRPDIILTWELEVKLPTYSLTDNTAILSGNKIVVNPTILEQEGKTSTAYEALLNNAFMHASGSFIFTPLPGDCDEALTPYFVFTSAPSGYVIAANGTELRQGGNLAARIETDPLDPRKYFIRLNVDDETVNPGGSWGNYVPLSNASKGLVGKSVSVQPRGYINGMTYNWINLRAPFNVEFTYPLEFNLPQDASVFDQANQGLNSYLLNLYTPTTILYDWNGASLDVTTPYGRSLIDHYEVGIESIAGTEIVSDWTFAGLLPGADRVRHPNSPLVLGWWYEPVTVPTERYSSPFVFDIDNAKCNINTSGNIVEQVTFPIPEGMQIKIDAVAAAGTTTVISDGTTYYFANEFTVTWENQSTGAVLNEFKVSIPVSVVHKWGTVTDNFVITVKVGSGN